MRFAVLAVSMALGFAAGHSVQREEREREIEHQRLFLIHRSTNRNVVAYDANLTEDGLLAEEPIRVRWILREQGDRVEELTGLERRRAFGITVDEASPTRAIFRIVSLQDRPITVERTEAGVLPMMAIGGEAAVLEEVFVSVRDGSLIPTVRWVEVRGISLRSGKKVRERIVP